jgi:hypothetical protein
MKRVLIEVEMSTLVYFKKIQTSSTYLDLYKNTSHQKWELWASLYNFDIQTLDWDTFDCDCPSAKPMITSFSGKNNRSWPYLAK